ncbi:MAG TPA: dockerin type I domain-containing protein, partial [Pirellulaceae bacterium]|nr:dockerin type I domain-containing protein [Pirellulaceae bacterium]
SPSKIAPVRVAANDSGQFAAVQGPNGTTQQLRIFETLSINPLSVAPATTFSSLPGPHFIAAIDTPALAQQPIFAEGEAFEMPTFAATPSLAPMPTNLDLNGDGAVTASDALLVVNRLNQQASSFAGESSDVSALDVNGDGRLTALDALLIINELNKTAAAALAQDSDSGQSGEEDSLDQYAADADLLFAAVGDW